MIHVIVVGLLSTIIYYAFLSLQQNFFTYPRSGIPFSEYLSLYSTLIFSLILLSTFSIGIAILQIIHYTQLLLLSVYRFSYTIYILYYQFLALTCISIFCILFFRYFSTGVSFLGAFLKRSHVLLSASLIYSLSPHHLRNLNLVQLYTIKSQNHFQC